MTSNESSTTQASLSFSFCLPHTLLKVLPCLKIQVLVEECLAQILIFTNTCFYRKIIIIGSKSFSVFNLSAFLFVQVVSALEIRIFLSIQF